VWENVTFADNYYQTSSTTFHQGRELVNTIPAEWSELNGFEISRADLNVRLDDRAGFAQGANNAADDPHNLAFAWYAGTANVSLDGQNSAFGTPIFRRKGDFSQDRFNGGALTPWYTNDFQPVIPGLPWLNRVDLGDPQGKWEGVGTGWYYSSLGGGRWRRNTLAPKQNRVLVGFDNTNLVSSRGDYAVPTLFNGNFDAISQRNDTQPIPGWMLSSSSPSVSNTQFNLKKWSDILPNTSPDLDVYANNYAIKLNNGDTLTHNLSVVPDWGVLRLDLYAPIDSRSKDNFGSVIVTIEEVGNSSNSQSQIIKLENAKNSTTKSTRTRVDGTTYEANIPSSYEADIYRLGYGVSGFETFDVNVDPSLRGKSVKIKITTDIATTSATNAIYLDNVFFKSEALKWGNPTNARNGIDADPNNYLIEKPQYTLSYNQSKNTINWVAWKVNKSWSGNASRPPFAGFALDPELAANNINPQITDANYESNYLRQIQDGQSIQNREKDEQGNFVYKGEDPLDTSIIIFVLSQDHQRIDSYRENAAGNRTYAKYYQLNPDPTTQGEIYYQDDQGSKYYYKSNIYDPQNPPKSNQILPNKLFDTDRGHLSAVEDRSRSKKDLLATFLTSNLIPQQSNNNQGIWRSLEQYIRKPFTSIPRLDTYLIAGIDDNYDSSSLLPSQKYKGIFDATSPLISLPTHIWKVILTVDRSQSVLPDYESLGVYLNNTNIPGTWNQYAGSIKSLQDKISNPNTPGGFSYNFLSNLSEIQASKINGTLKYRPNSASLLADTTTSLSTSFINEINESVTKAPVIVETILASSSENAPAESNIQTADINKIDISKVAFDKVNFIQIGVNPDSIGKITSSKPRTASQGAIIINRDTKVTSSKIDITPNEKLQIRLSQIGIADNSSVHFDISQETPFQSNPTEVTSTEIDSFIRSNPDIWKLSLPSSITSQQFLNTELFSQNSNPQVFNIESTAANIWNSLFNSTTPIKFNFAITNLPTGQLAEGTITSYNPNGTPKTATITIDDDANGVGWFIDPTPQDNSEFQGVGVLGSGGVGEYFQATANSASYGKYDLLTTILHEMGHTKGIINGYSEFDKYVKGPQFITDTFTANLTPDGSHLDTTFHPYDLMNTSLKPGVRKLPSALNPAMINAINSGIGSRESGVAGTISAPLTAGALIGITNGDFATPTTWNTAGATNIINGSATLTEQSQKLSELTQAFIIPTGAKTLQFTIKDNHLVTGDTTKTANDAFEVALLDTNTFNPLAGTSIGLNHTDSLLNIQANGTIHKSDKVTITTLGNNSSIVTIDLTQVTPSTQATLYFNLLGFGARTSTVTIDDVKLFTDAQPIPVTKNDILTTNQNTPLILTTTQLTTNDTNVAQIQVINQPTHGKLTQTPDGKLTYQPVSTYVGTDSFTYLGFSSDGQISNLATVNLTVNNLPPTIQRIDIPTNIKEGAITTLTATATDIGNDLLTYRWYINGATTPIVGRSIDYTFIDNGNYPVKLEVLDNHGGIATQTVNVTVNNVALRSIFRIFADGDGQTLWCRLDNYSASFSHPNVGRFYLEI
jgi:DNA/RNA endonuclease G (NUC1)